VHEKQTSETVGGDPLVELWFQVRAVRTEVIDNMSTPAIKADANESEDESRTLQEVLGYGDWNETRRRRPKERLTISRPFAGINANQARRTQGHESWEQEENKSAQNVLIDFMTRRASCERDSV